MSLTSTSGGATTNLALNGSQLSGGMTIDLGAASLTVRSDGSGKISFQDGVTSGSVTVNGQGQVTAATITAGPSSNAGSIGASVSVTDNAGVWSGTATVGISVANTVTNPFTGSTYTIPGSKWVNNTLSDTVTFGTGQDPCDAFGGLLGNACKALESGAQAGGAAGNEAKDLGELGLSGETYTNYVDPFGDVISVGSAGTIGVFGATGVSGVYSAVSGGKGLELGEFSTTGQMTNLAVDGLGSSVSTSSTSCALSPSSTVTMVGNGDVTGYGFSGDRSIDNMSNGESVVDSWNSAGIESSVEYSGWNGAGSVVSSGGGGAPGGGGGGGGITGGGDGGDGGDDGDGGSSPTPPPPPHKTQVVHSKDDLGQKPAALVSPRPATMHGVSSTFRSVAVTTKSVNAAITAPAPSPSSLAANNAHAIVNALATFGGNSSTTHAHPMLVANLSLTHGLVAARH